MGAEPQLDDRHLQLAALLWDRWGGWPGTKPATGLDAEQLLVAYGVHPDEAAVCASMSGDDLRTVDRTLWFRLMYRHRKDRITAEETADVAMALRAQVDRGAVRHMLGESPVVLQRVREALATPPWFVTRDVCELLDHAGESMPEWTLALDDLPSVSGLVVFAEPFETSSKEAGIDAPYWLNAVMFDTYALDDDATVLFFDWAAVNGFETRGERIPPAWLATGNNGWFIGTDVDDFDRVGIAESIDDHEAFRAATGLARRRMACLWALAKTPRLLELADLTVPRATRRRSQRAGTSSSVVLVDVRGTTPRTPDDTESRTVDWQQRWIVGGHWRSQPVGPGGSQRRPTWIAPHVKGPADKPLAGKQRIGVVRADPPPGES